MPLTPEAKVIYVHLAGFLARSYQTPSHSRYDIEEQWHAGLFDFLRNGPYSSGYCSGFTPDSLLNTGRMPTFHQKRCKIIKNTDNIIPVLKKYLQVGIFPVILASPF